MKTTVINFFKKKHPESSKAPADHGRAKSAASHPASDLMLKSMPSWWVVLLAYALAGIFCYGVHQFFLWFPPYLKEVFLNLKGLPMDWADKGLFWSERGLKWIAIAAAVYHNLWQVGTRYKLSSHDITVENWFPVRRVVSAPYGSVRRVGFQQSPLGVLFRYGHVEIETGSPSGPWVLLNCPKPAAFVALLQPKVEAVLQPGLAPHNRRSTDSHAQ
ncbi:MAG TPA: PH domain-containing protein [bacterium]|nr:PH domain-containing protein [bacterium]